MWNAEYYRASGASLPAALGCESTASASLLSASPSPAALQLLTTRLREVLSDTVAVVSRSNGAQEVLLLHDATTAAQAAARAVHQQQAHGADDAQTQTGMLAAPAAPWWAQGPGAKEGSSKAAHLGTTPLTSAGLASPPPAAAPQHRLHWEEHGAGGDHGVAPPGGYGGGSTSFEPLGSPVASLGGQEQRAGVDSPGEGSGHEPKSRQGVPMDARLYVTWRSQVVNPPATPTAQAELVPTLRPEDLWEFFSKFGAVAFCDVHGVRTPTPGASPAPRRHGMPGAGYAFVGFSAPGGSAAAHALLQVPSHSYRGAEIRVKLWRSSKAPATGQQQQQQSPGGRQHAQPSNGEGGGHRYLGAPLGPGGPSPGHTHAPPSPGQQLHSNGGALHSVMHGSQLAPDDGNDPLAALTHELQACLALDTHSGMGNHHHHHHQWHGSPLIAPSQGASNAVHSLPPGGLGWMGRAGGDREQAPAAFGGAVMSSPWAAAGGVASGDGMVPSAAWLQRTPGALNAGAGGGLWAAHGIASVDMPVRY